jgi:prephenate dehydrogenase
MTRLAGSDPRVAMGYCRANADEVRAAWRAVRARLDTLVSGLDEPAR